MIVLLIVVMQLHIAELAAECSPYIGTATINEVHKGLGGGQGRFIELKLLANVPSNIYNEWSLSLCYGTTPTCHTVLISSADIAFPYLVLGENLLSRSFYYDQNPLMDLVLFDVNGRTVDYLSINSYERPSLPACNEYMYATTIPVITQNSFGLARKPDGVGPWDQEPPGNSGNITPGASNTGQNDPPPPPHHLRLLHDGQGLTCLPEEITIQACQNPYCMFLSEGTVTVTLSPAGWVGGDTVTITGGQTTAQLRRTTPGSVILGATASSPVVTNPTRCFNGTLETCVLTFEEAGFVVDVPDLIANRPEGPVMIRAVKLADDGVSCAPAFTGSRTVNFWANYVNPNTGTMAMILDGSSIATTSPGTALNLTFDANAQASIASIRYSDSGQMRLNARYEGSGEDSGLVLEGSDLFVSRPVGLAVFSSDANAECVSGDHTCSVFRRAGEDFNLTVRAVAWTHDGDTDLNDNPITPNYRQSGIVLGHSLVAPAAGHAGLLGESAADIIAAGETTIVQKISEVGVFQLTATPPANAYFGRTVDGGISGSIGRFIPHHFEVSTNTPVFATACGSFSYAEQPFNYTTAPVMAISARNAVGGVTQNYRADFWNLTNTSLSGKSYSVLGGSLDTGLVPSPDPVISDSGDGTGTLTFSSGGGMAVMRTTPVAPFDAEISLEINLIDSDGVSYPGNPAHFGQTVPGQGISFSGGKEIRYGRMVIDNAHGPETLPLPIPVRTEYYNGSAFIPNSNDSCTPYSSIYALLDDYTGSLSAGDTTGSGAGTLLNGGAETLTLSAPGVGQEGSLVLEYNLTTGGADLPWLQFDWDGDGVADNNPRAKITFGIFKGNPRLIYMRESVW